MTWWFDRKGVFDQRKKPKAGKSVECFRPNCLLLVFVFVVREMREKSGR